MTEPMPSSCQVSIHHRQAGSRHTLAIPSDRYILESAEAQGVSSCPLLAAMALAPPAPFASYRAGFANQKPWAYRESYKLQATHCCA